MHEEVQRRGDSGCFWQLRAPLCFLPEDRFTSNKLLYFKPEALVYVRVRVYA